MSLIVLLVASGRVKGAAPAKRGRYHADAAKASDVARGQCPNLSAVPPLTRAEWRAVIADFATIFLLIFVVWWIFF
jgi:hypothetical protein